MTETIKIGIVGACGRGSSFKPACDALGLRVAAVCDRNAEALPQAARELGAEALFTDYETMLDKGGLDAVIVGTPMHLHARQSIQALERNLHVLSEVTAGVSITECRDLVRAASQSRGIYMMAENYTYMRENAVVRTLVEQGLFGTPYYAEGEYLHEIKEYCEKTPWRRKWQMGIDGITYITHSLGPILQWFPGERVTSLCCVGAGQRHRDAKGELLHQASPVMIGRMSKGGLVKIRVDLVSDRPHAITNYQLQGTDGCCESARAPGERDRIWLRSRAPDGHTWQPLSDLVDEFTPESWKPHLAAAAHAGHGGGDFFELLDFADAIHGRRTTPIGIHEAMDMTLPGLISQESIAANGQWLDVPDSRTWVA
jgi:predicted dehydrogenase